MVRKDASTLVHPPSLRASTFVLFYFLIYLFIYCFSEQPHNPPYRLEFPPNLKHAPIKLAIYLPRRQVPRSCSAHLGHALQYYK